MNILYKCPMEVTEDTAYSGRILYTMKRLQILYDRSVPLPNGMIDYRGFNLRKLNTPRYQHLKLLLYWPIFGLLFLIAERGNLTSEYFIMHCRLDDMIPFCEYFLIPYLFWFVFMIGMVIYSLLYEVELFENYMRYIIITYSVGLIIFFLFPTCQMLRPVSFQRDNLFTQILAGFYQFDTSTNVCPSLHVVGSLAVTFAGLKSKRLTSPGWKFFFIIGGILISISTVFVKQHSLIDVAAGFIICVLAHPVIYGRFAERPQNQRVSLFHRL